MLLTCFRIIYICSDFEFGTYFPGVKVFSLQPNIWEPPRDDVYIKYDFNEDLRFNETKVRN